MQFLKVNERWQNEDSGSVAATEIDTTMQYIYKKWNKGGLPGIPPLKSAVCPLPPNIVALVRWVILPEVIHPEEKKVKSDLMKLTWNRSAEMRWACRDQSR